jgi:transcriptional regulator with XRE-family HTH domain/predicted Fe-Mo cluster-binding NifX family protein
MTQQSEKNLEPFTPAEIIVGQRLRNLRVGLGYSLRGLAEASGLNVNTISLIESGKTSASIGTLQQLSLTLGVPLSSFIETEAEKKQIIFTRSSDRPLVKMGDASAYNLAQDLADECLQPFILKLEPGQGSGGQMIIHSGWEFVFCLKGAATYHIETDAYGLDEGDSLIFNANLPHCWENTGTGQAEMLMIFLPANRQEKPGRQHMWMTQLKKENTMKIAFITDDGKTISQHFGRARFYQVFTIEGTKIVDSEMRPKLGHFQFGEHHHDAEHHHDDTHGHTGEAHSKHQRMADAISDCSVVVCGGMGMGAYESMRQLGLKPIVTDLADIEAAVQAYIDGKLIDHPEKLH